MINRLLTLIKSRHILTAMSPVVVIAKQQSLRIFKAIKQ